MRIELYIPEQLYLLGHLPLVLEVAGLRVAEAVRAKAAIMTKLRRVSILIEEGEISDRLWLDRGECLLIYTTGLVFDRIGSGKWENHDPLYAIYCVCNHAIDA
jgi:hypothetical protein